MAPQRFAASLERPSGWRGSYFKGGFFVTLDPPTTLGPPTNVIRFEDGAKAPVDYVVLRIAADDARTARLDLVAVCDFDGARRAQVVPAASRWERVRFTDARAVDILTAAPAKKQHDVDQGSGSGGSPGSSSSGSGSIGKDGRGDVAPSFAAAPESDAAEAPTVQAGTPATQAGTPTTQATPAAQAGLVEAEESAFRLLAEALAAAETDEAAARPKFIMAAQALREAAALPHRADDARRLLLATAREYEARGRPPPSAAELERRFEQLQLDDAKRRLARLRNEATAADRVAPDAGALELRLAALRGESSATPALGDLRDRLAALSGGDRSHAAFQGDSGDGDDDDALLETFDDAQGAQGVVDDARDLEEDARALVEDLKRRPLDDDGGDSAPLDDRALLRFAADECARARRAVADAAAESPEDGPPDASEVARLVQWAIDEARLEPTAPDALLEPTAPDGDAPALDGAAPARGARADSKSDDDSDHTDKSSTDDESSDDD